jgi:hypothetical protein
MDVSRFALVPVSYLGNCPVEKTATEKHLRQLNRLKELWFKFTQKDLPEFEKWSHQRFARQFSKIREIKEKIFYHESLLTQISHQVLFNNLSAYEAYQKLIQGDEFSPCESYQEECSNTPNLANFFSKLQSEGSSDEYSDCLVKKYYRSLAKVFHPDLNKNPPENQKELWVQIQQAYRKKDVSYLEALYTFFCLNEVATPKLLPKFVSTLNTELQKWKNTPAWGFNSLKKEKGFLNRIKVQVREDISFQRKEYSTKLRVLQSQLKKVSRPPSQRQLKNWGKPVQLTFEF